MSKVYSGDVLFVKELCHTVIFIYLQFYVNLCLFMGQPQQLSVRGRAAT